MKDSLNQILAERQAVIEKRLTELRDELIPLESELSFIKQYRNASANRFTLESATIKQLITAALSRMRGGGKPVAIRNFIFEEFSRDIDRNTIGPQISRMVVDGSVRRDSDGIYHLTAEAAE
jgi:hypothetical protein